MWPSTRPDGSVDVSAEFAPRSPEARSRLETAVYEYVERKTEQDGVDLLDDLTVLPAVEDAEEGRLRVRFRGKPDRRLWKDWLVEFTSSVSEVEEVRFEGFFDEVAGSLHPSASS